MSALSHIQQRCLLLRQLLSVPCPTENPTKDPPLQAVDRVVLQRTNVDRTVDSVSLKAEVGVAEGYCRNVRGHGIAAPEHASVTE